MDFLFIDTNIFLHFYEYSGDDLNELDKLSVLMKNNKLTLLLPQQVRDEFYRKRDRVLSNSFNGFKKWKFDNQFPQVTKHYEEYQRLRESIKDYEKNKQALLEKLKDDIINNNLKADRVINSLFRRAKSFPLTEDLFQRAKKRYDLGNPPGKDKSYGDAIIWETLLESFSDSGPLHFISDDKDYYSEFDNKSFNPYLLDEWAKSKKSSFLYFRNLTDFFCEKFPAIKLADELDKNLLIERFAKSGSYATTHSILKQLSEINDFNREQINDIVLASISNNQIYWIASDQDINENLSKIVVKHLEMIDPSIFDEFREIYDQESESIYLDEE